MKVNFKNLVENLIIIIVIGLLCGGIGGYIGYKSAENMIKLQLPIIEQAIAKNTSQIKNSFSNEFKKIKNKKGEAINIIIDPSTNSIISNKDTTQIITVEQKKGFFKRLFYKKKTKNK